MVVLGMGNYGGDNIGLFFMWYYSIRKSLLCFAKLGILTTRKSPNLACKILYIQIQNIIYIYISMDFNNLDLKT